MTKISNFSGGVVTSLIIGAGAFIGENVYILNHQTLAGKPLFTIGYIALGLCAGGATIVLKQKRESIKHSENDKKVKK